MSKGALAVSTAVGGLGLSAASFYGIWFKLFPLAASLVTAEWAKILVALAVGYFGGIAIPLSLAMFSVAFGVIIYSA